MRNEISNSKAISVIGISICSPKSITQVVVLAWGEMEKAVAPEWIWFLCRAYLELHKYWKESRIKSIPLRSYLEMIGLTYLQERHPVFSAKVDEFYVFHPIIEENTCEGREGGKWNELRDFLQRN